MTQSDKFMDLVTNVVLGVAMFDIISHPDGFEAYMMEMWEDRCSHCGYRYNHPIVIHPVGYKGKECGWR